jgi:hypothetical protein
MDWPYSFVNICQSLNLNVAFMRDAYGAGSSTSSTRASMA